jgi:hypothetical protein
MVDHGRMVVLPCRRGQPFAFVEHELLLGVGPCAFPGLGNRCDECCAAAALENPLCRLTLVIKLPVPRRVCIGRVQDRMVEKWIRHGQFFSSLYWLPSVQLNYPPRGSPPELNTHASGAPGSEWDSQTFSAYPPTVA